MLTGVIGRAGVDPIVSALIGGFVESQVSSAAKPE
jgi:hypothetical protein